ncbi:MAG: histidinol-phosphate transaminase [Cytophagales bacterium]|nr:histidinol-phosphate transaminase [Cytophagales bacterium]
MNIAEEIIKLSQNENPLGPSPMALKAVSEHSESMNRYPEPYSQKLEVELASHVGVLPENIFACAGLVESLDIIIRNFVKNGQNMIIPETTFVAYKVLSKLFEVDTRFSTMTHYGIDINSIIENYNDDTSVIIIANPNNPTGTYINQDELIKLLEVVSPNTLVVSDEAYREYVSVEDYPDTLALQKKYPNLMVMRTFSKIYGLAGLRVGYVITTPELKLKLERFQAPFTVSHVAAVAASAAIKDKEFVDSSVQSNREVREQMYAELVELGFDLVPSQANFLFIHFPSTEKRDSVSKELRESNIIVRPTDFFGDSKAMRVTIPKPENYKIFIACFKNIPPS